MAGGGGGGSKSFVAIYGPMIYMAPYVKVLMRADPLRGQVGGGWALKIETFLGSVKWHRAVSCKQKPLLPYLVAFHTLPPTI
jgi:hypothetical protein